MSVNSLTIINFAEQKKNFKNIKNYNTLLIKENEIIIMKVKI